MNATPTVLDGNTVQGLLGSIGFVCVTGVPVLDGDGHIKKTVDFSAMSSKLRGRWGRVGHNTAIIDNEGQVFLRYGEKDVTKGSVFQEAVGILGCKHDVDGAVIADCMPGPGQHFDSNYLLGIICRKPVLA